MISGYLVTASAHIVWLSSDRLLWIICWIFRSVIALLLVKHSKIVIVILFVALCLITYITTPANI